VTEREDFIPVARPVLGKSEADAAGRTIVSGWVTQGPEVASFEQEFAAYVGSDHACAVSSCTTALHLALLAVGVVPGDEVITVSHSYIATANAIRYCGATPVFVDIDPATYNMDPGKIEAAVTGLTRAILCVHQMGMPGDLSRILSVAREHDLPVVEDAACAVGSEILVDGKWQRIGRPHGDIACFSFHPRKIITTGDGGMLTTSNPEWDRKIRLWRQHGMSVPDTVRHQAKEVVFESYPVMGYNYRLTDIQASVGRQQLKRLPWIVDRRRSLAGSYRAKLAGIKGLGLPAEPEWARSNWQSYCVLLPEDRDQRAVMQYLLDRDIATRRGIMCGHREQSLANFPRLHPLTESERAQDRSILLPLFPEMEEADQDRVAAALKTACS
jgi:perosamine synthetase